MTPQENHAYMAIEVVRLIVKPVIDAGGETEDILALLESIVVGVLLVAVKPEGDDPVLDLFIDHVRERIASLRLEGMETEGEA